MSYSVNGTSIAMTRGDTVKINVGIRKNGEDYTPETNDVITFSLKHAAMNADKSDFLDASPVLTKIIPNDTLILTLDPADTADLGFGKYAYDIQIEFENGDVDTFITNSKFTITPDVGGSNGSDNNDQGEPVENTGD